MLAAGSGYTFDFKMLRPGTDLSKEKLVTDAVNMAMLPKAIGGEAVCVDEDGAEDENCCRGFAHVKILAFMSEFEEN